MRITVVNERDDVLGYKDSKDRDPRDIIRVSGLWLRNSKGEILIAQRALDKTHDAGKWGPAAAGTVEEGETYLSNTIKEAREELGVALNEKQLVPGAHLFRETSHRYFAQHYIAKIDMPLEDFKIQKKEVENLRWIGVEELASWIAEKPQDFIASFPDSFRKYRAMDEDTMNTHLNNLVKIKT